VRFNGVLSRLRMEGTGVGAVGVIPEATELECGAAEA
jgi:hypothetical protein